MTLDATLCTRALIGALILQRLNLRQRLRATSWSSVAGQDELWGVRGIAARGIIVATQQAIGQHAVQ